MPLAPGESETEVRAAGFRQIDTKVRRCGDFGDYFFDGSWKAASYARPPEHAAGARTNVAYSAPNTATAGFNLATDTRVRRLGDAGNYFYERAHHLYAPRETPWTRTLCFKPACGLEGPQALWPLASVQATPAVNKNPVHPEDAAARKTGALNGKRAHNIPGYTGYIPGLKVETVYGSLREAVTDHCDKIRPYETKEFRLEPLTFKEPPQGKRAFGAILQHSNLKFSVDYGTESAGRKLPVKDHEVPPPIPRDTVKATNGRFEEARNNSAASMGRRSQSSASFAHVPTPGWGGFRPQRSASLDPRYVVRETADAPPGYTGCRQGEFV